MRKESQSVVIMSLEETAYLLKSPANAARLRESIEQYEQGKCQKRNLIEE